MKTNATLISCYTNAINKNEECMKTIGDRIEEFLREFGRARYENALPYTQVELVEMLTGQKKAPVSMTGRRFSSVLLSTKISIYQQYTFL